MADLCPGTRKSARGLCIRCDRQHERGGMEPRARLESGIAVCPDWQPLRMVQRNRMCERLTA